MKRTCRILLFAFLLAALPLRGYAGMVMALCESQHGGAAVAETHMHEYGDSHRADSDQGAGGPTHSASVCGVCASCCASAGLAVPSIQGVVIQTLGTSRVSSLDRQFAGFVPEHPERPPLAL